jgi:peptide/nickel transport system permease protein
VIQAVAVVAGVLVVSFALVRVVPGDAATTLLGARATEETIAALREQLGLDQPWFVQFGSFLGTLVTTGDTGRSIIYGVSVREMIADRVGLTLGLLALAVVFAILLAVPLAFLAATHRDGLWDHAVRVFTTLSLTAPSFWVGLILILVFSVHLGWFPVGGARAGFPVSFILPALTASLTIAPQLTRSLRLQLLDTIESDFVATYRAVHFGRARILLGHVVRNSLLPFLGLLGTNIAYLIGGALVIERVFDLDGVGGLMFDAISNRDLPVIQGTVIYTALSVVVVTTLVGVVTRVVDPRVRVA